MRLNIIIGNLMLIGLLTWCMPMSTATAAEKQFEQVRTLPLQPTSDWNSQVTLNFLPSADLHNMQASVDISDYRFRLARNLKIDNKLTLTVGGGYGLKHINASPGAGLPQDLHGLFIETGAYYRINEKSFATLKMFPGLYSDFRDISGDDLRMPVLALGGYSFDSGITMVGGFAYRFGYHAGELIPVIGFTYQLDQHWRLDLMAPRPGITYIASRQIQLFASGDFASDEYELKDPSKGAKAIKYSDYKVMGGVEYQPSPAVKLIGAIGYAFDRRFDFYDGNRQEMRMDGVPFMRISLDFGW